ncbi:MAG: tetratricopeptide repeat protein [Deltaproteobacteria bacterium]|nr:tetratricopeptide repeat protein [Deltaproteobacteria bacterium]
MILLFLLALLAGWAGAARADGPCITAGDQFSFAEGYFERGEYFRAIGEYERFLHFFPDAPLAASASLRIGQGYFKGEKYDSAKDALETFLSRFPDDPRAFEARMLACECETKSAGAENGEACLKALLAKSQAAGITSDKDRALFRLGRLYMDKGDWKSAEAAFSAVSPEGPESGGAKAALARLSSTSEIPRKSPALAGTLSLVPGLGQLYVGRKKDALAAFLVNGALIWAAAEAFDRGENGLGAAITLVGAGFYAGNINGAVNSAKKYNKDQREGFVKSLQLGFAPVSGGASIFAVVKF